MIRLFALCAYALFLGVFTYFIGFVTGIGVPKAIDDGVATSAPLAVAIDVGLVVFFGAVHSTMARAPFKRAWTRLIPPAAERSVYVLVASAQVALLCWLWRPLAGFELWRAAGAPALALRAGSLLGFALALLSTFLLDHFELFGLRQGLHAAGPAGLRTPWLYRWVRHPLYLGMLIGLWVTPTMTGGHLLLAAAMTAYVLVGVHHEERDLVRAFGDEYRRYQARVPRLVPLRLRARPLPAESAPSPSGDAGSK